MRELTEDEVDGLLERARAASRLLTAGVIEDGPLLLSYVVWPTAAIDNALSALWAAEDEERFRGLRQALAGAASPEALAAPRIEQRRGDEGRAQRRHERELSEFARKVGAAFNAQQAAVG